MRNPLDTLDTKLWSLFDQKPSRLASWILVAAFGLIAWALYHFLGFFVVSPEEWPAYSAPVLALLYALLTAGGLALLYAFLRKRDAHLMLFLLLGVAMIGIMLLHLAPINYRSGDYNNCLVAWADKMRYAPFYRAVSYGLTNYNPPYEYLIFLLSHIPLPDLYLYKLLSMVFDLLCAWLLLRIATEHGRLGTLGGITAFLAVLCWPTFVLNSAMWAQCDSIFVAFGLAAMYFALGEKPHPYLSAIAMGLSLAFKLQAIFLLPMVLALWGMGRLRLKHILLIPVTYLATMLPGLVVGMPFHRVYSVYLGQAGEYEDLVLDAPSVFQLLKPTEEQTELFASMGIFFAVSAMLILLVALLYRRKAITTSLCWDASLIMVLVIPFLLPRMHDRYFYLAEMFALVYVCLHPRRFPVAILLMLSSLNSYLAFLQKGPHFIPQLYTALVVMGVLCYLIFELARAYRRLPKDAEVLPENG